MMTFLKPMQAMLSRLARKVVALSTSSSVRLKPLFGVLDLIAKAAAFNMKQHKSWNSCIFTINEHPLRTHESMIRDAIEAENTQQAVNGIKGHTMF